MEEQARNDGAAETPLRRFERELAELKGEGCIWWWSTCDDKERKERLDGLDWEGIDPADRESITRREIEALEQWRRARLDRIERDIAELHRGGLYDRCHTLRDLGTERCKLDWHGVSDDDYSKISIREDDLFIAAKGIVLTCGGKIRRRDIRQQYEPH